ncbi:placenta growth factor [Ctenodactylus gundi]
MPAMRLLTCLLQLLAGLALPTVPPRQLALSAGNSSSELEVVPFYQVWGHSYCRPRESLVNILAEYPDQMEYFFSPPCVSLMRCMGCCGSEDLHCMSVKTANITMQVLKISIQGQSSHSYLTFSQDVLCECRPLQEKTKPERRRPKVRGKRKKQRNTDCHQ